MATPIYRPEDEFQEKLNEKRLKELFSNRDYQAVLEFALLLNHQAFYNNSRAYWAINEAAKNMSEEFSIEKYKKMIEDVRD